MLQTSPILGVSSGSSQSLSDEIDHSGEYAFSKKVTQNFRIPKRSFSKQKLKE